MRNSPIDVEPRLHEDELWALPPGDHRSHGGPHAEATSLVARGCNNTARSRAADGDRLAPELRIVPLLDGSVKRVHIDMNDLAVPSIRECSPFVERGDHRCSSLDLRLPHENRGLEASLIIPTRLGRSRE